MSDQELREINARASKVKTLQIERQAEKAVSVSLENPPLLSGSDKVKDANAQVVMAALSACSKGEMQRAVAQLSPELEDNLMKYIYRGLTIPQNNSMLLEWHAQLVNKAGIGCVVRALTDRNVV